MRAARAASAAYRRFVALMAIVMFPIELGVGFTAAHFGLPGVLATGLGLIAGTAAGVALITVQTRATRRAAR